MSLLFGIDLVGDKVIMDPKVSVEPSYEEKKIENTGVFPACAVILAMEKPLEEDGTIETSDVELKSSCQRSLFSIAMAICLVIL